MSMTIKFKDNAKLYAVLHAAFPSYSKHGLFVTVCESVEPFGYWWDSGSRSDYHVLTLAASRAARMSLPNGPPPFCKIADTVRMIPGTAVVTTGTFCGKNATMRVFLHPIDAESFGLASSEVTPC